MPAMWGIIGKINMFNSLAKSVVRRRAGVAPPRATVGLYRHVRV
jgi:hypothetical protein